LLSSSINAFMAAHHKECDDLFAQAEKSVADGNWDSALQQWREFTDELENHFCREEQILFPEFEQATGMSGGPTRMMRMEHEQIRALVNEINKAGDSKDMDQFLALTETLMITMQQHNMKEEQILYPMTDQSLTNVADIIERMLQI